MVAVMEGNKTIEENCHDCTKSIDRHISEIFPKLKNKPNKSLISVQYEAGLSDSQNRANVKLAIARAFLAFACLCGFPSSPSGISSSSSAGMSRSGLSPIASLSASPTRSLDVGARAALLLPRKALHFTGHLSLSAGAQSSSNRFLSTRLHC